MANAMTKHSKNLRVKTASNYNKKVLENGTARRITMQLPTSVANNFDIIATELGLSRPECLKILCELYLEFKLNKAANIT
ncbi:hypothetical protein ACFSAV_07635 [Pasteurella oralis]|uniref:Protein CopB n=1 Tax=Pasteurella oralis TaxID=1071947 RepID=A0ABW4NX94_9PAST